MLHIAQQAHPRLSNSLAISSSIPRLNSINTFTTISMYRLSVLDQDQIIPHLRRAFFAAFRAFWWRVIDSPVLRGPVRGDPNIYLSFLIHAQSILSMLPLPRSIRLGRLYGKEF